MGQINWARIASGGLLAGLIMNISQFVLNTFVLGKETEDALRRLNLKPVGAWETGMFIALTFVVGILMVWLYAAIRPRFGPGPRTALVAGFTVWFLSRFVVSATYTLMGIFPATLMWIGTGWGLVEIAIAALVAGWLYKES
jgi:MFS family permease